ncbi:murein DD-endopeptidase MepM/ murein hydrolase activator NlpD [Parabacteroides sp. PM5-20]|uniref:M23 family metallopeptidase n=1 Tax=Parabacteroides sp. PM5-20 TaxID=2940527 RepID=UPI002476B4C1|nr:M23 family metallopeptidase [Parabacteroides sp. PM5-20]MDH6534119.1 murein DD-endopeptidase MepM/ murein hydrolase activator NlpD [Parabacteroides sp. PM5-20]
MKHAIPLSLLFLFIFSFSCTENKRSITKEESPEVIDTIQHIYQYGICIDSLEVSNYTLKNGDNPASIFSRLGFSAREADHIGRSAANVLDPTKLRTGMSYCTFTTMDSTHTIRYIAFAKSHTDYAIIDLTADSIRAYGFSKAIRLKRLYTEGTIHSSLWNEIQRSGADPLLALKLADVFAWQIDFFDVKKGDSFRVLYDVAFIDDTTALHVAAIKGAVFTHKDKEFIAVPFTQDSVSEYFDEKGNSLRKAFLKAPLDFFRITSRFSHSRFHPVLKIYRAHHGVDYAAPVGTPVKSIGVGTVIAKGYQSGGGNYVKIKHNSVYTTTYMHLSKFAQGLQVGTQVAQGQVIAYVGSTGLSTGPHLDFRVHKNGQPINPLEMESPPSLPVKPELMDSFAIVKQKVFAELDSFRVTFRQSQPSTSIEQDTTSNE